MEEFSEVATVVSEKLDPNCCYYCYEVSYFQASDDEESRNEIPGEAEAFDEPDNAGGEKQPENYDLVACVQDVFPEVGTEIGAREGCF